MNWNRWIRQTHRWTSVAFTAALIFNFIAVLRGKYANWMGLLVVPPIALLFFTGVYLFVLPYLAKRRARQLNS